MLGFLTGLLPAEREGGFLQAAACGRTQSSPLTMMVQSAEPLYSLFLGKEQGKTVRTAAGKRSTCHRAASNQAEGLPGQETAMSG